jgi:hypothetical protein
VIFFISLAPYFGWLVVNESDYDRVASGAPILDQKSSPENKMHQIFQGGGPAPETVSSGHKIRPAQGDRMISTSDTSGRPFSVARVSSIQRFLAARLSQRRR